MSIVGALQILLSLDSAQVVSDVGKAKQAVRAGFGDMQRSGQTAMAALTRDIGGMAPALRGIRPATAVAHRALELLGEKGSSVVSGLMTGVSALARGGFTPLGIAAAGATAAISLLAAEAPRAESVFAATTEGAKSAAAALETLRAQIALAAVGGPMDAGTARLFGMRGELTRRVEEESRVGPRGLRGNVARVFGQSAEQEAQRRIGEQQSAIAAAEEQEYLERQLAAEQKKRQDEAEKAARKRVEAAQAAARADQEAIASTKALVELTRQYGQALAERRAQVDAIEAGEDPALAQQRARVRAALGDMQRGGRDGLSGNDMSRLAATYEHEQKMLELLERERAVRAATSDEVLVSQYEISQIDEWILELQQDRAYLTREETEELERQRKVAAELGEEMQKAWETGREFLEGVRQSETARMMTPGRSGGPGPLGTAFLDASQQSMISGTARAMQDLARGAASAQDAVRGFALGFVDAMQQVAAQQAAIALMKSAFAAFGIASPSADQLASGPAPNVTVTSASPTGAAHGGTWRVAGVGGLDSQYVRMKLSPGELVRVTDGANQGRRGGGDGGFHGTLVVRPPAVVASEVAAKMDRNARASIVASATARPGRRARRAEG